MTLRAKLLHHLQSFVDLMQIISSDRQKNREAHSKCTPLPLFENRFLRLRGEEHDIDGAVITLG